MSTGNFGEWLSGELQHRGWEQAQLAKKSGITSAQISRIMSLSRNPGAKACRAIAKALGVDENLVFQQAGLMSKDKAKPLHPLVQDIIRDLEGKSEEEMRAAREVVRATLARIRGEK